MSQATTSIRVFAVYLVGAVWTAAGLRAPASA
jgi:hypothetical protein